MKRIKKMLGLTCEPHTAGMTKIGRRQVMAGEAIGEGLQLGITNAMNKINEQKEQEHMQELELSGMGWSQSEIAFIREKYNK